VELFDYSLWAAPVGLVIGTVELIWHRRLLPLLLGLVGVLLGSLFGRVAWEWVADPQIGFEFGTEFEGYDWVAGLASVGGLIGALARIWLSARRHRRDSAAVRQGPRG
jgi:prolipoprotein diacylglyceryltransferase